MEFWTRRHCVLARQGSGCLKLYRFFTGFTGLRHEENIFLECDQVRLGATPARGGRGGLLDSWIDGLLDSWSFEPAATAFWRGKVVGA